MPPKAKFTKEEIVEAALALTRAGGLEAVTARDVAARLGVSTRPIFTYFSSMEELKAEVRRSANELYMRYIHSGLSDPLPFFGVGFQYIRFAREEPELYKLLFFSSGQDAVGAAGAMSQLRTLSRPSVMAQYRMDEATADRYIRDMWLCVHALASLIVTGNCPYSEEQVSRIMSGFSLSLCKACKEIPGFAADEYDRDKEFSKLIEQSKGDL